MGLTAMNGGEAYRLVCAYSAYGIHRTGWSGEAATVGWLSGLLVERGADVSLVPYSYAHFDAEVDVAIAGRAIEAMPLYYCVTGRHEFANPSVGSIDAHADEVTISSELARLVADAKAGGHDGIVLATQCPTGALCAINRLPASGVDFPVVLVPGHELGNLVAGDLEVCFSADVRSENSSNILARFPGPGGAAPVVVTTPVSGWFTCAGERGCGIAVAIRVAEDLAAERPVDLLLATGHELGYLGGHSLAQNYQGMPAAVVQIGSSIANREAEYVCRCSASVSTVDRVSDVLKPHGVKPKIPDNPARPENWIGESECWAGRRRPMLSIAGQSPHFHTPGDVPAAVTLPELLQKAMIAIEDAAKVFVEDAVI